MDRIVTFFQDYSFIHTFFIRMIYLLAMVGIADFCLNLTSLIKKYLSIKEYDINVNIQVSDKDIAILDSILTECLGEYLIVNGYANIEYITEQDENNINKQVGEMVAKRMSPAVITKLSLIYNSESLSEIIAQKIYISVMSYVIEKNRIKTTKEKEDSI